MIVAEYVETISNNIMLLDFVNSKKNDIGQRIYHFQNRESSREAQAKNRYRKTIKTKMK